jgi:hypothetical protein
MGLKIKLNYESIGFKIMICYYQYNAHDDSRTKELNSKILLTYADRSRVLNIKISRSENSSSSHFRSIKQKEIIIIT